MEEQRYGLVQAVGQLQGRMEALPKRRRTRETRTPGRRKSFGTSSLAGVEVGERRKNAGEIPFFWFDTCCGRWLDLFGISVAF